MELSDSVETPEISWIRRRSNALTLKGEDLKLDTGKSEVDGARGEGNGGKKR